MLEDAGQTGFDVDSALAEMITPSPNFSKRRAGTRLDMVIMHYTGMATANSALDWLCREEAQVSCHYFVFEDGRIAQLVAEEKRAWHAGLSCWRGESDINSRSIGIEIANPGHEFGYVDFPDAQMDAVVKLVGDIALRHKIPAANILAHSDIAPMRKQDPGERFDWQKLHSAGLGKWVEASPIVSGKELGAGDSGEKVRNFQVSLRNFGFEITANGEFDMTTIACTKAFQRHFRQEKVDGVADQSTVDTLHRLLELS